MKRLNASGVEALSVTNCAHVDFTLAGFAEELNYAVEEQGFVGLRDLQYMSAFLRVDAAKLRTVYTGNVEMLKRAIALLWAVKNNTHNVYCERCGHPLKAGIRCTSATICEERQEAVSEIAGPFVPAFAAEELVKAYNIIWRALSEKFTPEVQLNEEEISSLDNLRTNA